MRKLLLVLFLSAGMAAAQTYPSYKSTTVNDYAHLLDAQDEHVLSDRLAQLRRDTGVEMTVVTLASQSFYAPDQTLEQFATGLFNTWGIGDAKRNDGVLVLVLRDDRAMRIELGAGYGRAWDGAAVRVIDDTFLPAFKADDYARGILQGSSAVISDIVMPFRRNEDAPAPTGGDRWMFWLFAPLVLLSGLHSNRKAVGDTFERLRKCPVCGRRGLRVDRTVSRPATASLPGTGNRRLYCLYCDHSHDVSYSITWSSQNGSSGGFGGGRSGGGGGSGRW
jgi:uncharacterized protein